MTRTISRIFAIAGLACLLIAPTAYAQLAQIDMGSGDVLFHPNLDAAEWTLTVHTPDEVFTQTFKGSETPSFDLGSVAGTDGAYQWELVRTPNFSASHRAEMAAARADGVTLKNAGEIPVRQSGSFTVAGGAIVTEALTEAPSNRPALASAGTGTAGSGTATAGSGTEKAQYFATDVIVDGSLCVGMDCVNGENFGFDTMRLKENNLRIHFDDTSNSGSFPSNDWRITANSSDNGGASYLSIDDATAGRTPFRVEAGADNNSLRVLAASSGNPRVAIGADSSPTTLRMVDGNTPSLRLEQDGSAGFNSQIWDVAGNEVNFFIRDISNGSKLPFRIEPNAPENSIYIEDTGDIGMGTNNPGNDLHIKSTANVGSQQLKVEANEGPAFDFTETSTGLTWRFINYLGTLTIADTGSDPNVDGVNEFVLTQGGNLTIQGSLFANNGGAQFPDYVFTDDYELMDLDSLASFIDENGHLPKIHSADEVEANGGTVNMTQLQIQLLEKVEELTLYTIAQHEQIGTQDQVIHELKTEKQELMERLDRLEQMISER